MRGCRKNVHENNTGRIPMMTTHADPQQQARIRGGWFLVLEACTVLLGQIIALEDPLTLMVVFCSCLGGALLVDVFQREILKRNQEIVPTHGLAKVIYCSTLTRSYSRIDLADGLPFIGSSIFLILIFPPYVSVSALAVYAFGSAFIQLMKISDRDISRRSWQSDFWVGGAFAGLVLSSLQTAFPLFPEPMWNALWPIPLGFFLGELGVPLMRAINLRYGFRMLPDSILLPIVFGAIFWFFTDLYSS